MTDAGEITHLLAAARRGEADAFDRLVPLVYDELRGVARRQLRRCRPGQTLDTTALVHEAYLKLAAPTAVDFRDREHFLSVAAVAMRHILVDAARRHASTKRGGKLLNVTLNDFDLRDVNAGGTDRALEILAVDQALGTLSAVDERLSRLVELIFFGGLNEEEAGQVLGISDRTVRRDWRKARAFLFHVLSPPAAGSARASSSR
jgi:RNA polymerase sigma factor (TIGR02999 family)